MNIINAFWRECGYPREQFWRTETAAPERVRETARRMAQAVRAEVGVFGLRICITEHPVTRKPKEAL